MTDFNVLHQNIMGADTEHTAAKVNLDAAAARHTEAMSMLCEHQKAFDDAVATFRNGLPHDPGSYWGAGGLCVPPPGAQA